MTKKPTNHERAMAHLREVIYRTLRDYQDGKFEATTGVAAGALTIPLTTVNDRILREIDYVFNPRLTVTVATEKAEK